ncbi:MAG: permease [Pelotomaculum sp.]|nr:permease [Pelotomaculum sp.]
MSGQINSLQTAFRFFIQISLELVILFIGITFLVSLILQYVSQDKVQKVLAGKRLGLGNLIGAAVGGITPFCSCSAVPMLMGLLELGIPFGVAMSFLIASPLGVFNPVVLSLFGALLGSRVLLLYIITTFIAAVLAGIILEALGLGKYVKKVRLISSCCSSGDAAVTGGGSLFKERLMLAVQNAVGLFRQMVPYLLIGVAIGAFVYGFVPESFLVRVAGPGNPLAIPVAAAIGVPMYVRTETMIPVGFAMIKKGVSVGAIMALTIGGAGASIPELSMLAGIFKRRLWIAYIVTMFSIATLIGYLFNYLVKI